MPRCNHPNLITLADGESVCTACGLVLGRARTRALLEQRAVLNRRDAEDLFEADVRAGLLVEVA